MKKTISVLLSGVILSGCMMTNQAFNVTPKSTDLDGYWSANDGFAHTHHWFIRPDGTGVYCDVKLMSPSGQLDPLVMDIAIVDNKAYLNNTYEIVRLSPNAFKASTWGGSFALNFKRAPHPPAACKQFF